MRRCLRSLLLHECMLAKVPEQAHALTDGILDPFKHVSLEYLFVVHEITRHALDQRISAYSMDYVFCVGVNVMISASVSVIASSVYHFFSKQVTTSQYVMRVPTFLHLRHSSTLSAILWFDSAGAYFFIKRPGGACLLLGGLCSCRTPT